jgi:hypothetical protein
VGAIALVVECPLGWWVLVHLVLVAIECLRRLRPGDHWRAAAEMVAAHFATGCPLGSWLIQPLPERTCIDELFVHEH